LRKISYDMKERFIITGAGLVGSLWAVFLANRGYHVDVYERRPDMRELGGEGGRSINLALSNRGWKALEKAGVAQGVREEALPMRGRMMHSTTGELTFQAYGQEGQAIYSVSRAGLNRRLMDMAEESDRVTLHFDTPCQGMDTRTGRVFFEDAQGRHFEKEADYVFGADGAFSALRGSLQKTPRFNYSQHYLEHGYKELHIPATPSGEFAMQADCLHIWPRGQFMLIALPNPDSSFTCTLFLPFEGEESFENLDTDEKVLAFFNTYFQDAVPLMPSLLEDFKENPTSSLVTVRCNPWQWDGRTLLIGDASHAIVPFYGQGMNSGFEDCSLLDDLADKHQEDWEAVIREFNATRIKDANAIADLALRNFIEMRDQVGDPMFLLRKKIAAWLQKEYPGQFVPMYSLVTFSHVPYSEALRAAEAQDELFEEILALPGIQEHWGTPEVREIFERWKNLQPA
jgi:kynurenine 3-monooxygenase